MKLSEKRQSALYEAISEPIMKQRILCAKAKRVTKDEMDASLYNLETEIFNEVKRALNFEENQ